MELLLKRITINPDVCNSKPVIKGMRITASTILEFLSAGETLEEILKQYPSLEKEDIAACLLFAVHRLNHHFTVKDLVA